MNTHPPTRRRLGSAIPSFRVRVVLVNVLLVILLLGLITPCRADEFEQDPIKYSQSTPDNIITRLQAEIDAGRVTLRYEDHFGYLRSALEALRVPQSSQMLVFSKTSLQRERIAPRTPRAIYFNDDVYVGFCQNGDVMEVSAVDPRLGAVFYTLDQRDPDRPRFSRQGDNCLICHASSNTQHVPGHLVRSVYPDSRGFPLLASGTFRIDHTSPIENRWGGWYVTGTHGAQKHLGNLIAEARTRPEDVDNSTGMNVKELGDRFRTTSYLTPHSDIVALMVLEHQVEGHNLLTRASFLTRQALYFEKSLNSELKEDKDKRWDSTTARIRSACEPLVRYLLFSKEARLSESMLGTSEFAAEFQTAGVRDSRSRSLRDLDLTRRLFKYPCSYLVYSQSFQQLPVEAKDYVFRRFSEILDGADLSPEFRHLTAEDRTAIREILAETLEGAPAGWRGDTSSR